MRSSQLEKECRTYTRYLIRQNPTEYVVEKYHQYHQRAEFPTDSFDRLLIAISSRLPFLARLVDTYASRFRKQSAVRKKLVLMLALLECSPPCFEYLDSPDSGSSGVAWLSLAGGTVLYGVTFLLSVIVICPLHLLCALGVLGGEESSSVAG